MAKERIDKILSHNGFGSRKDIKKLLRNSEVLVNETRIYDPGFQINQESDKITIDGEEIDLHDNIYLMMNKPMHTVSANKDGEHQTVFELLEDSLRTPYLQDKLHLIGRLDMDTEGLLLFTTDGELTHRLISPKSHISKTYLCVLEHSESPEHKKEIATLFDQGIEVSPEDNEPGFKCQSAEISWASKDVFEYQTVNSSIKEALEKAGVKIENPENQVALLKIYEGKYHQVKRMFTAVNNKVIFLKRISVGSLQLEQDLQPGEYLYLNDDDLEKLNTSSQGTLTLKALTSPF